MKPLRRNTSLLSLSAIVLSCSGLTLESARASTLYWDTNGTTAGSGAATGTWDSSTANWTTDSTGVAAPGALTTSILDNVFFSVGTNGTTGTVTVSGTQSANSITFDDNVAVTLSGGTSISLGTTGSTTAGITVASGDNAANAINTNIDLGVNSTVTNNGTGTLTLGGVISGTGFGLTKAGSGTLTLSGADTFTGGTAVNAGTLSLTGSLASTALSMGGGIFSYDRAGTNTQTFTTTTIGAGSSSIKNTVSTDTLALWALTQNAGGTVFFTTTGAISTSTADQVYQGGNMLGGWAVIDNGNNTYDWAHSGSSGVNNITAATYVAPSMAELGNVKCTSNVTLGNSQHAWQSILVSGATLNYGAWNLYLNSGGLILENGGTYTGSGHLICNTSSNSFFVHVPDSGTIGAAMYNGDGGSAAALYKDGPGTLTLSGMNTFTGNLVINGGTVAVGTGINGTAASSIASNLGNIGSGVSRSIIINNGGNLSFTGGNITGWDSGTVSGVTLVVNQGGVFQTGVNGTGAGYWNKMGPITLNGGSVLVGNGDSGSWGGALSLLGTVTVGGSTPSTIGILSGATSATKNFINIGHSNTGISSVTFDVADVTGDAGADLTVSPRLADRSNGGGASNITKTGAGTMALTATDSTYTGVTTINAGTLSVASLANGGSASSIGQSTNAAGNLVFNGGTLQYTGAAVSTDRLFSLQSSSTIDASGTGAVNFTNTGSMGFNSGTAAKTLTLTGSNTGANTLAAVIGNNTGATSVTKSGAGAWTLTNTNTYAGGTTINGGTLALSNSSAAGTAGVAISGASESHLKITSGVTVANNITFSNSNASSSVIREVAAAGTYNVGTSGALKSAFAGGKPDTTAKILAGTNSSGSTATLTMSFSDTSSATNDAVRQSDVFSLSGTTATDTFVIQLSATGLATDSVLAWNDGTKWVNAVTGNTGGTANFILGAYNNSLTLGNYGFDSSTNSVWAVVNHGGSFAAIPELSNTLAGLLIGAGLLRRRRN